MNHAQLSNAAKASRITLPDPDHPKYDLVLRAQANAELMRREARRLAEDDLYYFCTVVLGYGEMLESLHRPGYVTGTFHARFLDGDPRLPILRLRDAACPRAHRCPWPQSTPGLSMHIHFPGPDSDIRSRPVLKGRGSLHALQQSENEAHQVVLGQPLELVPVHTP